MDAVQSPNKMQRLLNTGQNKLNNNISDGKGKQTKNIKFDLGDDNQYYLQNKQNPNKPPIIYSNVNASESNILIQNLSKSVEENHATSPVKPKSNNQLIN